MSLIHAERLRREFFNEIANPRSNFNRKCDCYPLRPTPTESNRSTRGRFRNAPASTVVHIDKLLRFGEITDDLEPAHGFLFRNFKGCLGHSKISAIAGIFRPLTVAGEIFQRLRVFDKRFHNGHFSGFARTTRIQSVDIFPRAIVLNAR